MEAIAGPQFGASLLLLFCALSFVLGALLTWTIQMRLRSKSQQELVSEIAALKAVQETERASRQQQIEELKAARSQLNEEFQATAARALAQNTEQFLSLAQEKLSQGQIEAKGELETRKQAVAALVKPLSDGLEKMQTQISALEREREGAYRGLKEQISGLLTQQEQLRAEAAQLSRVLSKPEGRGSWGELQLRRVVELADMQAHCDFEEQVSISGSEGMVRPDMVIHLPGDRLIAVDAKTPLNAYRIATDAAKTDQERANALREHALAVQTNLKNLGKKRYWEQFSGTSPDLVVLFLPGEALFSAALDEDPALIDSGLRDGVLLASPTTLIALLRAVHYGWRQETLATSAREISALGSELYTRLVTVSGHAQKLGSHLGQSVNAFNNFVSSFESRVLVSGRKLSALHLTAGQKELAEVSQIAEAPRNLAHLAQDGDESAGQLASEHADKSKEA